LEDRLTSYCFRRGTSNAVNDTLLVSLHIFLRANQLSLGAASNAVRDQVLRHDPNTGVFSGAYRDKLVRFNMQDAFLENNISNDGLTRAFTYISIQYNPGALKEVPKEIMKLLSVADPDIIDLKRRVKELYTDIK
jgi:hypothetical protein